ncbi:inositol polyphosphate 1-phosphatase [Planococcus citri]|uniref:inositol polyphosphate 1-phosphatase n=1 Tax=Planococcus citri TaxID=170843 RepID=UPI0031F98791
MIRGKDLVTSLIIASEKAARVARICRQNPHLLSLLVEEKTQEMDKNCRFVKDFKTLADVLVQQAIKYDLEREFSDLKGHVYGEESESFTNTNGDHVAVNLNEDDSNTFAILRKVLDGDEEAANVLTKCVHSQVDIQDVPVQMFPSECGELPIEEIAIWIDPIDSTAEYISGENTSVFVNDSLRISLNGLNCVTVLIGVFNRITGEPIIGVINQPFYSFNANVWQGRCFWGYSYRNNSSSSIPSNLSPSNGNIIAVSAVEKEENRKRLEDAGFTLISPAGAGFKILCVVLGQVSAYVLSYGSTYFWDTCGCHAILKSLGGNILNYDEAVKFDKLSDISYQEKNDTNNIKLYANKGGIIASKDEGVIVKIVDILKQTKTE